MKNLPNLLLLAIAICSLVLTANAQKKQKPFEGVITYAITAEGRELDANEKASMPTEVKVYFKGNLSRTENVLPMGTIVSLTDFDTKINQMLLDIMGQKIVVKSTKEDIDKTLSELPASEVKLLSDTKTILGYNCKKAEITSDGKTSEVYYTDELAINEPNWYNQFKDIKGVLMEYTQPADEKLTLRYTVKEIKKQKVKGDMYTVPTGYTEMKPEELKSLFGG